MRRFGQFIFLEEKRFFIERGLKIIDLSAKLNELCSLYGLNFTHLSRASYCHSSFTPFNFSRWLFDLKIDANELHQNRIQFFYKLSIKNEDLNY